MFRLTSASQLSLSGVLLLAAACGHHGHHEHDAAVDPSTGDDAGVCRDASCGSPGATGVVVRADFNQCPRMAMEVSPIQAYLDQPIMVTSHVVDPENDALTFEWTSEPDSTFEAPDAPVTYFHCDSIGRKTIHLAATDARGCEVDGDVEVSCVNVNAFVNAGTQQMPAGP
ncbi:MAG: hypothetical protein JWN04_6598 [Myxococcaceae bacterium]|nr:hypothetical protein [Myxococcaceae bacterium]